MADARKQSLSKKLVREGRREELQRTLSRHAGHVGSNTISCDNQIHYEMVDGEVV